MTLTGRFDALPEPVQRQLIRIARRAAGMSADEKMWAQCFFAGITGPNALTAEDEAIEALEMVSACLRIVGAFDELSGDEASGLVV